MKKPVSASLRLAVVFLLCFASLSRLNAEVRDPNQYFFSPMLGDLTEEADTARDSDKKAILIMFEADDCPFCARMKKTILNQSEVQDYYRENFHILAIDIEGDVEITDFKGDTVAMKDFSFKQHRVRATPVFAFFDFDGNMLKGGRYTGAMTSSDEFMQFGRFIAEGIYKEMNFTSYKRSLK
jgi:thioredoxin-related protein